MIAPFTLIFKIIKLFNKFAPIPIKAYINELVSDNLEFVLLKSKKIKKIKFKILA